MGPFDYINDISYSKKNLLKSEANDSFEYEERLKEYSPFLATRAFSYFPDTIFISNETNKYLDVGLDSDLHHDFLFHMISKRKRFSKWFKNPDDKNIKAICEYYNVSEQKGREYLNILTSRQLKLIIKKNKNKNEGN